MSDPLAYLLTWTTHGTWLHGDARGSIERDAKRGGTRYVEPNAERREVVLRRMPSRAVVLDEEARRIVRCTIEDHCAHRDWRCHALNVRTNHVHVVVTADTMPEAVMSQFKAWATRRLREKGLIEHDTRVWTEHGSTRWIDSEASFRTAVDYVRNHQ